MTHGTRTEVARQVRKQTWNAGADVGEIVERSPLAAMGCGPFAPRRCVASAARTARAAGRLRGSIVIAAEQRG
jgi:hypothetical protein